MGVENAQNLDKFGLAATKPAKKTVPKDISTRGQFFAYKKQILVGCEPLTIVFIAGSLRESTSAFDFILAIGKMLQVILFN